MRNIALLSAAVLALGAASPAIASDHHGMKADIVDTAVEADGFNTLVAAVQAADLVDALKGDGPFTVFAPTDAAFDKIPDATLNTLLQPENKDQLTSILTYHVVPGEYLAEGTPAGTYEIETLQGEETDALLDLGVTPEQLAGNLAALIDTLQKLKPSTAKGKYWKSVTLSSTMGPGIRLDTNEVQSLVESR